MPAFSRFRRLSTVLFAVPQAVGAIFGDFYALSVKCLTISCLRLPRRLLRRKRTFFAHFTSRNIRIIFFSRNPCYKVNSPLTGRAISS